MTTIYPIASNDTHLTVSGKISITAWASLRSAKAKVEAAEVAEEGRGGERRSRRKTPRPMAADPSLLTSSGSPIPQLGFGLYKVPADGGGERIIRDAVKVT